MALAFAQLPEVDEAELYRLACSVLGVTPRDPAPKRGPRGGMSNAEKCRRHRKRSRNGVATPIVDTVDRCRTSPNDTESTPVSVPPCPPSALPSDPPPDQEKHNKNARVRANDGATERRPSCLPEALELGVCSRAELVISNARDPEWVLAVQPQNWPEVRQAAERFAKGTGRPGDAKLGTYARDAGTRAIVELFGAGHMPSVVYAGLERIASSEWYRSGGASRGLSSITPEVFRREGTEAPAPVMEGRPRAAETSFRTGPVVPPPKEVNDALDALGTSLGGKAGIGVARRRRAGEDAA
jgi:hypothetical protein